MKNIILLFSVIFLLLSCNSEKIIQQYLKKLHFFMKKKIFWELANTFLVYLQKNTTMDS